MGPGKRGREWGSGRKIISHRDGGNLGGRKEKGGERGENGVQNGVRERGAGGKTREKGGGAGRGRGEKSDGGSGENESQGKWL